MLVIAVPDVRRALARMRYRAWQFTHGLRPAPWPHEIAEARARLSPGEWALFIAQHPRDRRHSLDLYRALREACASEAALTAALVHDVGKGRVQTWHRVLFVVLEAVAPAIERRLESEHAFEWQRGLWWLRHHARLSAALLQRAGSAPRVVEMVARHTDPPPAEDPELARFIAADDSL